MYNERLVTFCQKLVNDSITKRSQVRTHFGPKESEVYIDFKILSNQVNFNFSNALKEKPFNELVYIISHDSKVHKCHCGKDTEFMSIAKGYAMHCSKTCKFTDPIYLQKLKDAKLNISDEQKAQVSKKRAVTNLEKYGVEYTMQNPDLAAKQLQSRSKQ